MRRLVTTAVMLVLVLTVGSDAFAQRDAGAKARGDHDGFWSAASSQRGSTNNGRIVRRNRTFLMRRVGRIATVPPMIGLAPASSTPATTSVSTSSSATSVRPSVVSRVRSNSSYSSSTTSKPAWMFQKTDPRRSRV